MSEKRLEYSPGIFFSNLDLNLKSSVSFGDNYVRAHGLLVSKASQKGWNLFMDGLFINSPDKELEDAEFAINIFLEKGPGALQEMDGFFNILITNDEGDSVYFVSDLLCSRPWYMYSDNKTFSLSPTPILFSEQSLEMNLNPQALYEQIRLLHTGYNRTLIKEIERVTPGYSYFYNKNEGLIKNAVTEFKQQVDPNSSLESSADKITNICRDTIHSVLNHPKLKNLPVQLPLTGGLDSRHLLGELIYQKKKPDILRHILIQKKDYEPVKEMAKGLDIPLDTKDLESIDTFNLILRWLDRTGGLSNIHQYYLLNLKNSPFKRAAISFNGYLMDLLMGMAVKTKNLRSSEPHKAIWKRTYSSPLIRRLSIPDSNKWKRQTENLFKEKINEFKGEPWFKMLMLDIHHRGLHYTGNIDTMMEPDVYSFSPASTYSAFRLASTTSHDVAGDKKARLHALSKSFPEVASYPGVEGFSFSEVTERPEIINSPFVKNTKNFFKSLISGFKDGHAPESEHAWIRRNKDLHKIHKKLIFESQLVEDGHLKKPGVKFSWYINQLGGYQGWMLMSVASAELCYRILVKKQPLEHVIEWLKE